MFVYLKVYVCAVECLGVQISGYSQQSRGKQHFSSFASVKALNLCNLVNDIWMNENEKKCEGHKVR